MSFCVGVPVGCILIAHQEITQRCGQQARPFRIPVQHRYHRRGKRDDGLIESLGYGFVVVFSSAASETALDAAEHQYLERGLLLYPAQSLQQLGNQIFYWRIVAYGRGDLDGEYTVAAIEQLDSHARLNRLAKCRR